MKQIARQADHAQSDRIDISKDTLTLKLEHFLLLEALYSLRRVGAVAEGESGLYTAVMRYYMPDPLDPDAMLRSGSVLEDLGNTAAYNLAGRKGREEMTRFEGRATNATVRVSAAKKFRLFLEGEAQGMLERVDAWLSVQEASPDSKRTERTVRLGVGVYQIQDDEER